MSCGKVMQNTLTDTFRKKRRRKTAKKKKRKPTPSREECELARITEARRRKAKLKDCPTSLAEMACQGFAGENYARRASFSTVKRRSRLTLTGRRRQATFAEVFVLLNN